MVPNGIHIDGPKKVSARMATIMEMLAIGTAAAFQEKQALKLLSS